MGQIRIWHNLNFKKGRTKGLKCKNEDLNKKWIFSLFWPNMALTQKLDLRPKLVSFEGDKTVKEREEGEKKKKRKRKRRRRKEEEFKKDSKVWNY